MKFYDKIIGISAENQNEYSISFGAEGDEDDYFEFIGGPLRISGLTSSGSITSSSLNTGAILGTTGYFSGNISIGATLTSLPVADRYLDIKKGLYTGAPTTNSAIRFYTKTYTNIDTLCGTFSDGGLTIPSLLTTNNLTVSSAAIFSSLVANNIPYLGPSKQLLTIALPTTGAGKEDLFYVLAKKTNSSGALIDTPEWTTLPKTSSQLTGHEYININVTGFTGSRITFETTDSEGFKLFKEWKLNLTTAQYQTLYAWPFSSLWGGAQAKIDTIVVGVNSATVDLVPVSGTFTGTTGTGAASFGAFYNARTYQTTVPTWVKSIKLNYIRFTDDSAARWLITEELALPRFIGTSSWVLSPSTTTTFTESNVGTITFNPTTGLLTWTANTTQIYPTVAEIIYE